MSVAYPLNLTESLDESIPSSSKEPVTGRWEGIVRPYADERGLGVVGVVIVPPRTNPRDSVLPPRPATPSPSPSPVPSGGRSSQAPSPAATASVGG